jgi:hypothetical protein
VALSGKLIELAAGLLLPLSALSRQADGSYTGFEMTGENPSRLIRAVPNYGKALSACVDKKARSSVNPALIPGPPPIGPQGAVLKSGNILMVQTSPGPLPGTTMVNFQQYDANFGFVSSVFNEFPAFQTAFFADVTGDGNPDMITSTCSYSCSSQIYAGRPDGTFQGPALESIAGVPLLVTDVNGDGFPDLFVSDPSRITFSTSVSLFYGMSDGSLGNEARLYSSSTLGQLRIAAGDLNMDGKPDVVLSSSAGPTLIALNDGKGNFPTFTPLSALAGIVSIGDVNGDGLPDIVAGGSVLIGDGKGGVVSRTDYAGGGGILMDFDGDGIVECHSQPS